MQDNYFEKSIYHTSQISHQILQSMLFHSVQSWNVVNLSWVRIQTNAHNCWTIFIFQVTLSKKRVPMPFMIRTWCTLRAISGVKAHTCFIILFATFKILYLRTLFKLNPWCLWETFQIKMLLFVEKLIPI